MHGLVRDIVGACRSLVSHRSFAASAVLTVALAVGGTSAVFAVFYGVLHRPPPYPEAGRLVRLWEIHPGAQAPIPGAKLSGPTFRAWAASADTVEGIAAYSGRDYTISADGRRE